MGAVRKQLAGWGIITMTHDNLRRYADALGVVKSWDPIAKLYVRLFTQQQIEQMVIMAVCVHHLGLTIPAVQSWLLEPAIERIERAVSTLREKCGYGERLLEQLRPHFQSPPAS